MDKVTSLHNFSAIELDAHNLDRLCDTVQALREIPAEDLALLESAGSDVKNKLFACRLIIERKLHDILVHQRAHAFTQDLMRNGHPRPDGDAA